MTKQDLADSSLSLPSMEHSNQQLAGFLHIFENEKSPQHDFKRRIINGFQTASMLNWAGHKISYKIPIYANDAFFVGRNPELCRGVVTDITISNRHIRVHCIDFELESDQLPPLVYVEDLSTNGTFLTGSYDQHNEDAKRLELNQPFLVNDGDQIRLGDHVTCVFECFLKETPRSLTKTQDNGAKHFGRNYTITERCLGFGGNANVFLAIDNQTSQQMACKILNMTREFLQNQCSPEEHEFSTIEHEPVQEKVIRKKVKKLREIQILKNLDHPNIVHIKKVYRNLSTIYVFQELYPGGDLHSYCNYKGGCLQNGEAAFILYQVLRGLAYLHQQNIVHRDVKLDNVLLSSYKHGARAVLSDFGAAICLSNTSTQTKARMYSVTGTYTYMAPEVLRANATIPTGEGYSKAVDSWSVGVMTSYILTATNPFTNQCLDESESAVLKAIGELGLSDHFYDFIAPKTGIRPANLIQRLCELDETSRLTIEDALEHPWFTNDATVSELNHLYEKATRDWTPRVQNSEICETIPNVDANSSPRYKKFSSKTRKMSMELPNCESNPVIIPDSQPSELDQRVKSSEQQIQDLINQDLVDMGTQWDIHGPSVPRPRDWGKGDHIVPAFDFCDNDSDSDPIESDFSFPSARKNMLAPLVERRARQTGLAKSLRLHRKYDFNPNLQHAFKRSKVSRYAAQWPVPHVGDGFRDT